jgi:hypothetical protein
LPGRTVVGDTVSVSLSLGCTVVGPTVGLLEVVELCMVVVVPPPPPPGVVVELVLVGVVELVLVAVVELVLVAVVELVLVAVVELVLVAVVELVLVAVVELVVLVGVEVVVVGPSRQCDSTRCGSSSGFGELKSADALVLVVIGPPESAAKEPFGPF